MYTLATFIVSNPDGSQPTECEIASPGGVPTLTLGGPGIPMAVLPDFVDGCRELLDQPRGDGEVTTQVQVTGGPLLTYTMGATEADDTLKPHGSLAAPWSRAKIEGGLLAALAAFGLA